MTTRADWGSIPGIGAPLASCSSWHFRAIGRVPALARFKLFGLGAAAAICARGTSIGQPSFSDAKMKFSRILLPTVCPPWDPAFFAVALAWASATIVCTRADDMGKHAVSAAAMSTIRSDVAA